jgi:uncharacterized iron-regulated membrane protein
VEHGTTGSRRFRRLLRGAHAWVGVLASLNLLVIITTGFLIQHRDQFDLQDHYVSRRWLPSAYRLNDGATVRSDIFVTDLHSGQVFGGVGSLVLDLVTLAWFALLISGLILFRFQYWRLSRK